MHTAAPRGICRVTHTPRTLLPPSRPPVLPRLLQSPPPCRLGTPGRPDHVGSHLTMLMGPPVSQAHRPVQNSDKDGGAQPSRGRGGEGGTHRPS